MIKLPKNVVPIRPPKVGRPKGKKDSYPRSQVHGSVFKTLEEVKRAMHKKLEDSMLNVKDATNLKFNPLTAVSCAEKLKTVPAIAAGFVIPYFDMDGHQTKFWRYRYLETVKHGFSAQTDKKELRYAQPKQSLNELYLPPLINWRKVAKDAAVPLVITEGELKAACACKLNIPTIGLGGVWCFKSNAKHLPLLKQFEEFAWEGRVVYIVYDSDAATNTNVVMAENFLAHELMLLGALPHIVRLPQQADGAKNGLDDFLALEGKDALIRIMDETPSWRAAKELYELNQEVVYVEDPGFIMRLDTLQIMKPRDFYEHAYAPRRYFEEVETERGTKVVQRSAAKEWLVWPQRNTVKRLTYAPGEPMITADKEFNTWQGWGVEPENGIIKPWNILLDHLFEGEPESRKWFEQWLAYPLQHPGVKMFSASVLWGVHQGTGKSLVGYSMFRIYGRNAKEIKNKDLHGNFNAWANNKQFIMGDEITSGDKRGMSDYMKSIITQEKVTINQKHVKEYDIQDRINYYFTSNHPDAFFLEDDDRRYFIHEVRGKRLSEEFYESYDKWLNEENGAAILFNHLLSLDVSGFRPKSPAPVTRSKLDMINTGRSDLGSWVAMLKEDPDTVLRMDNVNLNYDLWRAEELLQVYDPSGKSRVTTNGLAREMRRANIQRVDEGKAVPTGGHGRLRLWIIRNPEKFAKMGSTDIGRHYIKERNMESNHGKKPKY